MPNEDKSKQDRTSNETTATPPSGFFKRIFTKVDAAMKAKADQAAQSNCCSDKDGKGGKCC
jgi:hypothetical protein